ncbi:gamma-butyrobetaine hydroxylase-like domain-containing protein [Undibacterium sp. WLX3042]|uniref:gamma-butyrobetaine hydroxylase-like domain-containing protein n=1 Tax=Undibacterium sp. WLX3042 TaxID=3412686 RepID=UPI003C2E5002
MMSNSKPQPTSLNARTQSKVLEISFDDGKEYSLPFELLRVYSPSAEVRGHGPGQETLQTGKREVSLVALEPVGNYAVKPIFSDEHSSGIFSWDYLYWLGENQDQLWQDYLTRLQEAGYPGESGRDAPMAVKSGSACGHHH